MKKAVGYAALALVIIAISFFTGYWYSSESGKQENMDLRERASRFESASKEFERKLNNSENTNKQLISELRASKETVRRLETRAREIEQRYYNFIATIGNIGSDIDGLVETIGRLEKNVFGVNDIVSGIQARQ